MSLVNITHSTPSIQVSSIGTLKLKGETLKLHKQIHHPSLQRIICMMSYCETKGFYGRVDEDSNVLGHDAVSIGKQLPEFRRSLHRLLGNRSRKLLQNVTVFYPRRLESSYSDLIGVGRSCVNLLSHVWRSRHRIRRGRNHRTLLTMRHILLCQAVGQSLVSRTELHSVPEVSSSMITRAAVAHVCILRLIIFSCLSRSRYFEQMFLK